MHGRRCTITERAATDCDVMENWSRLQQLSAASCVLRIQSWNSQAVIDIPVCSCLFSSSRSLFCFSVRSDFPPEVSGAVIAEAA